MKKSEYIVIAMGSAQYSHTLVNPFTAGERYTMISRTLEARGIENYHLIGIEDIHRYAVWVAHVEAQTPKFDVVYAHNPLSVRLFSEAGYDVVELQLYEPDRYSGTEVRRLMIEGEDWQTLVPDEVADFIDEINGVERLRTLAGREG